MYRLYLSINQAHDLRAATTANQAWVPISQYTNKVENVFRGEIGTLHGFRVIEADTAPTFTSTLTVYAGIALGTSTLTVYAGIALGAIKGWGSGELQSFRAYHTAPGGKGDELHQIESVGWKVNFGCAPLNNSYYYRVESAATSL
jgi:N4-gp56 family major capsid protein